MKLLTIFTPTYNRAYILPKLYESLCNQTSKNFVWSIVDDGSTDSTETIVKNWIDESIIEIVYVKQSNGGKMRAHNYGVKKCKTELFMCVDSDDYLMEDTVNTISLIWNCPISNKEICGIVAYRLIKFKTDDDYKILSTFPNLKATTLYGLYCNGFKGDTSLVFRTDVLRAHLFPEIEGEKFITEAYVYDQIDQEYKLLICNQPMIVCEYRDDGYTHAALKLKKDNPEGWALFFNQRAGFRIGSFSDQLRSIMYYIIYARLAQKKNIFLNSRRKGCIYYVAFLLSWYYEKRIKESFKKNI